MRYLTTVDRILLALTTLAAAVALAGIAAVAIHLLHT